MSRNDEGGKQQDSQLSMAERRALFDQQGKEAADGVHRTKSGSEQEENQASDTASKEKNLTLKERMAKFGVPTDSAAAQSSRPLPKAPHPASNPTSPTAADTPDSELQYKMGAFNANKQQPTQLQADPPMLSTLNSPLQTANTSPRNAPPASPESEEDSRGPFAVAAKNGRRGSTPETSTTKGEGGQDAEKPLVVRSTSLKDRMATFTGSSIEQAPSGAKPTPQAVPAPSKSIAEKRAAFAAAGPASAAEEQPAKAVVDAPKQSTLANRMAAFSAGTSTDTLPAVSVVESVQEAKQSSLADRVAAFSKPAEASEPAKPDPAPTGTLAERKAAFSGAAAGTPASAPAAEAKAEAPLTDKGSSLADRMAAFKDKPQEPPPASDSAPKAVPEAAKASTLADRMAAFSGGSAGSSPPEKKPEAAEASKLLAERVASLKKADAAPPQEAAAPKAATMEASKPGGSLADRMAAFSGAKEPEKDGGGVGGGGAAEEEAATSPPAGADPPKGGSLADRMAAFSGGGAAPAAELTKQTSFAKKRVESAPLGVGPQAAKEEESEAKKPPEPAGGGGMSLKERMTALQQGANSKSDDKLDTKQASGPPPLHKRGSAPALTSSQALDAQKGSQSNTDASALSFWKKQQQGTKPEGASESAQDGTLPAPTYSKEDAEKKIEKAAANFMAPKVASSASTAAARSSINPMHLTHQAREVMSALEKRRGEVDAAQPAEEEAAKAEGGAKEEEEPGVKNRASLFEQSLKGGYERDAAKALVEPGRIWGAQRKEKAVESAPIDMNDVKSKWQTGAVKTAESKTGAASEDALFRCHVAASTRTGGVAELQNKFLTGDFSEKQPEPKKSSKIAEIAETIHFDPNTMMPGAQHPNLNYNVQENTRIKDGWRDFNGGARKNWDEDDEELPPPPTMMAR